ncbi:MAG: hypothetical protein SFU83_14945 [Meiothermus sp.]|nr:hypothetical protein [Meiothermus sp.]
MAIQPEPRQNRDMNALAQEFRNRIEVWLAEANQWLERQYGKGKAQMLIVETSRTLARQQWIYKHGRVRGYGVMGRPVTWTLWSAHRLNRAIDATPQLFQGGRWVARWDLMDDVLRAIPLRPYGLEGIPQEKAHIQLAGMYALGNQEYAKARKLVWDRPERSRWPLK